MPLLMDDIPAPTIKAHTMLILWLISSESFDVPRHIMLMADQHPMLTRIGRRAAAYHRSREILCKSHKRAANRNQLIINSTPCDSIRTQSRRYFVPLDEILCGHGMGVGLQRRQLEHKSQALDYPPIDCHCPGQWEIKDPWMLEKVVDQRYLCDVSRGSKQFWKGRNVQPLRSPVAIVLAGWAVLPGERRSRGGENAPVAQWSGKMSECVSSLRSVNHLHNALLP